MELEKTADGSYTLYVPALDEHYHSVKGALTESRHVFIGMGLEHTHAAAPRVLEVGLGTGLNCFLTLIAAEETRRHVHYTAIENQPPATELLARLDYPAQAGKGHEADYEAIHRAPWETDVQLTPWLTLHKVKADFTALFAGDAHPVAGESCYDVIYFDAFAPEKQPAMWTQPLFDSLARSLAPGGTLVTYCAKGAVRRMLQAAGLATERLPGPPGGKREILRATKPTSQETINP